VLNITFSVSLWNYYHYAFVPELNKLTEILREQGYGIELWGSWKNEDIYSPEWRSRLKQITQGMRVSLHSTGSATTIELHKKQIDTAAEVGAKVIVNHPEDFYFNTTPEFNEELCNKAVEYAETNGVKLALENGKLPFLVTAINKVPELNICLDVGHVYFMTEPMTEFLSTLKNRLIHLHIQDILPKIEDNLPHTGKDHFIPGTGDIPTKDWQLIMKTLKEINYDGIAVFEIQPRNTLQTAFLGKNFIQKLIDAL
jgi:sugar phosphate isomerase/epimerase